VNASGANTEAGIVIGVLGEQPQPRAAILAAITAAGATADGLTEATALAKGGAVDALVLDVSGGAERLLPAVASLTTDPRTRKLPRVLVVDGSMSAERLARFGPGRIVPEAALADELDAAIAAIVEEVRGRDRALRATQTATADVRALEQTLAGVQRDGATLSHDARVLFGVILGFASNLRDGFGGPVTELQHRQLVNIVEASTDAAALLDRYVTTLRRLIPPSADPARVPAPRAVARRHVDVGELVRGTVTLFEGIAAAKHITLQADAAIALYAWCDAMQIKQALVNLLSNALKYTPPGGIVDVVVRPGAPATARGGPTARRDLEIIVSDDGPGIPAHERERVFERGVRLERDQAIPGTGVGLATVRDIVTLHGGFVQIGETTRGNRSGGTTIALSLPADLRSRTDDHARTNGSPAPPRLGPASISPSAPRLTELRREPE